MARIRASLGREPLKFRKEKSARKRSAMGKAASSSRSTKKASDTAGSRERRASSFPTAMAFGIASMVWLFASMDVVRLALSSDLLSARHPYASVLWFCATRDSFDCLGFSRPGCSSFPVPCLALAVGVCGLSVKGSLSVAGLSLIPEASLPGLRLSFDDARAWQQLLKKDVCCARPLSLSLLRLPLFSSTLGAFLWSKRKTEEEEEAEKPARSSFFSMGALYDEAFPVSQRATFPVFPDRIHTKVVFDNVHRNIYVDPVSLRFIDTEQFQRLRDVKQLGLCHLVFPGGMHSRFEHSLGVYWLAGQAVQRLSQYQAELEIDRADIANVKLAGLLHDVGHGPFSHVFENEFLPRVLGPGNEWTHEEMSRKMVEHIVDEHNIDVQAENLKTVQDMIVASSHHSPVQVPREKRFLYDIVANGRNGIDVDKFDYLERDCRACGLTSSFSFERLMENMRVIDNEICYRAKECSTVYKLFQTRAELFRVVYTHAKVKALEFMLADALVLADNYLQISKTVFDPSEFWKLDDTILKTIETSVDDELKEAKNILIRIRRRKLYQYCNEYAVPKEQLEHFKHVTPEDIACSQRGAGFSLRSEDIVVSNVKIDLTRGKEDPVNRVHFFQDYDSNEKFGISKDRVSHLLPDFFEDRIVRVYSKKPELVDAVSEAFEHFQRKTYGTTTQVHGTPERKKLRHLRDYHA